MSRRWKRLFLRRGKSAAQQGRHGCVTIGLALAVLLVAHRPSGAEYVGTTVPGAVPATSWLCVAATGSLVIIKSGASSKAGCISAFYEYAKGLPASCQPYSLSGQSPEGYYSWDMFGYHYGLIYDFRAGGDPYCWPSLVEVYAVTTGPTVTYRIILSSDTGESSSGQLAEIEPGQTTGTLRAKVYDNNNQLVANANIELAVDVSANSGGHQHDNNRNTTQMGMLSSPQGSVTQNGKVLTGITDGNGLAFTFQAPTPAGDHTINARCTDRTCNQEGPNQVWVGVKDLVSIPPSGYWDLIGKTNIHPDNHYLTSDALGKLTDLAYLYTTVYFPLRYNTPILQLNDASLVRGGVFDIAFDPYTDRDGVYHSRTAGTYPGTWWAPPHKAHRRGVVIDIQANGSPMAIPERNFTDFERLLQYQHVTWIPENLNHNNGHYHVQLLGVEQ